MPLIVLVDFLVIAFCSATLSLREDDPGMCRVFSVFTMHFCGEIPVAAFLNSAKH